MPESHVRFAVTVVTATPYTNCSRWQTNTACPPPGIHSLHNPATRTRSYFTRTVNKAPLKLSPDTFPPPTFHTLVKFRVPIPLRTNTVYMQVKRSDKLVYSKSNATCGKDCTRGTSDPVAHDIICISYEWPCHTWQHMRALQTSLPHVATRACITNNPTACSNTCMWYKHPCRMWQCNITI